MGEALGVVFVFDFDLLRLVVAGADLAESVVLGVGFDFVGDGVEGHACYETRRGRKVNAAAKNLAGVRQLADLSASKALVYAFESRRPYHHPLRSAMCNVECTLLAKGMLDHVSGAGLQGPALGASGGRSPTGRGTGPKPRLGVGSTPTAPTGRMPMSSPSSPSGAALGPQPAAPSAECCG